MKNDRKKLNFIPCWKSRRADYEYILLRSDKEVFNKIVVKKKTHLLKISLPIKYLVSTTAALTSWLMLTIKKSRISFLLGKHTVEILQHNC